MRYRTVSSAFAAALWLVMVVATAPGVAAAEPVTLKGKTILEHPAGKVIVEAGTTAQGGEGGGGAEIGFEGGAGGMGGDVSRRATGGGGAAPGACPRTGGVRSRHRPGGRDGHRWGECAPQHSDAFRRHLGDGVRLDRGRQVARRPRADDLAGAGAGDRAGDPRRGDPRPRAREAGARLRRQAHLGEVRGGARPRLGHRPRPARGPPARPAQAERRLPEEVPAEAGALAAQIRDGGELTFTDKKAFLTVITHVDDARTPTAA